MVDDRFLNELRRDPDPAFAARLRERLDRRDAAAVRQFRWRPVLAASISAAVVIALFAFPSVRASAQAVLDLFRVRNFAAVKFDPSRLEKLRAEKQDSGLLMFGKQEVLQDPGQPQQVGSPQAAGAAAGIEVRTPADVPRRMALEKVMVEGPGAGRLTADAVKLRALLDALDIHDLDVPPNIDGKSVTVRKPPIVFERFASDRHHATLIQARSPEVELPAGVDLAQLAELGMRILGVDRTQARRLAQSVDWHTTLLVPVPGNASSFRGVEVQGNPGLLITTSGDKAPGGEHNREGTVLLWSERDRVYALTSDLDGMEVLQMAESVR